jgi:hypothetical protein
MAYRVQFTAVYVDEESEEKAMQEAAKRIYEDPEFFIAEAIQIEEDELPWLQEEQEAE